MQRIHLSGLHNQQVNSEARKVCVCQVRNFLSGLTRHYIWVQNQAMYQISGCAEHDHALALQLSKISKS